MTVKGIIVGAGIRGKGYSQYAKEYPGEFEIAGVAEPRLRARMWIKDMFSLNEDKCFENWQALTEVEKFADCVLICTQDQDHVGAVLALAAKRYHVMVEKPMAVTAEDCRKIYEACKENNVILAVCHVLRYHPCVKKMKEIIASGVIGHVVNINHVEPVGFWHFAHSFVRGNWANSTRSTFSLLSKCCHDVDLICYWMSKKCTKLSSFGSLQHFKMENKPSEASSRCWECKVEATCPYSAKKIYLDPKPNKPVFPMKAVCDIEDSEEGYLYHLTEAVKTGPYGKCVYDTDNNVCDNQVVNFEFEDGSTSSLTMVAFSEQVCNRKTSIYGTRGELQWDDLNDYRVEHYDFLTRKSQTHICEEVKPGNHWGHGGSDLYTIQSFIRAVAMNDSKAVTTGPQVSLASHLLTFAAEESRLTGNVVYPQDDPRWRIN